MTIEELNKLIKEELEAYLGEDEEDGGDDIEVTTDEPEDKGDEAIDTLRQIFNMLKPLVEPEEEEEPELDDEGEEGEDELDEGKEDDKDEKNEGKEDDKDEKNEAVGYPNYRADQISKVKADATDVNQGLNESVDMAARWKKLANIK
jgi:hypothetical protein